MNKWKCSIVILLVFFSMIGVFKVVDADSGWDSSYDSGGSWDSGSSWDSDYSWSTSGGTYYGGGGDLDSAGWEVTLLVVIIVIVIIVISSRKTMNMMNHTSKKKSYSGLSDEQIKEKDNTLDKEMLQEKAFTIYKEVQVAWMNFDYGTLRKYLTDEIYNMYESQLKTLKIKNQMNVMKDIVLNELEILSIDIHNGVEEVRVYLNVSQYDYVVDKNDKVLRGTAHYKNNVDYIITLVRSMDNKKVEKCPNCGAPVDIVSGGVCPYCDSTIVHQANEFVMSKKECVGQWKEK